nr:GNAT family N-acetyltransferase [uncultured Brevundimonas sp.]
MTTPLTTDRLILTPAGIEDFTEIAALWKNQGFTQFIMGRALSDEEVWFRLLRDIGHWAALDHGNWSIRLKDGGAYLGSVGVLNYRREMSPAFDAPELGWGLDPAFQGRGYAVEALTAALGWADRKLGAVRTVCMISPDNLPSIKLAARVGYQPFAETTYNDHAVRLFERSRTAP